MKKLITCGLAITTAAMVLTACAGSTKEDESGSIFEPNFGLNSEEIVYDNTTANNSTDNNFADANDSSNSPEDGATTQVSGVSICDDTSKLDYSYGYDDEIKVAVERAVAESNSFDEEFAKMDEIEECITNRRIDSETQADMNIASGYYFKVWDDELNNLWKRFTEQADEQTKERVLADQRNWNALKEEAALEALGPREEGGSIYPVLYNDFMENSTKTRCYVIAKELSAINGSSFTMPEKNFDGMYIDNQGTGSVYGSLVITSGWETGFDAKISMYRVGELNGSVEKSGTDSLSFVSEDGVVKGIITYGWDGATFEVTEINSESIVSVGEKYEFPFVF